MTKPATVEVSVETLRRWRELIAHGVSDRPIAFVVEELDALLPKPCEHEQIELDNWLAVSRSVRRGETARCQSCKALVAVTWSARKEGD